MLLKRTYIFIFNVRSWIRLGKGFIISHVQESNTDWDDGNPPQQHVVLAKQRSFTQGGVLPKHS